jgi:hypothetical protein
VIGRFLRFNSLSLFFLAIFVVTIAAQSVVGLHDYNEQQSAHDGNEIGWWRFVRSSAFGVAVLENWQSEWLQFFLFILATVWFLQQGSPESKQLDKAGLESDAQQKVGSHAERNSPRWARPGGVVTRLYENSLLLAFGAIFVASWFTQSVTGWTEYNNDQEEHGEPTVGWSVYLTRPDFWAHAPELAVGIPRGRDDGRLRDLPSPARVTRVEARRRTARRDRANRVGPVMTGPGRHMARPYDAETSGSGLTMPTPCSRRVATIASARPRIAVDASLSGSARTIGSPSSA